MKQLRLLSFSIFITLSLFSQEQKKVSRLLFYNPNGIEWFQTSYEKIAYRKYDKLGSSKSYFLKDSSESFFQIELIGTSDSTIVFLEYDSNLELLKKGEFILQSLSDSIDTVDVYNQFGEIVYVEICEYFIFERNHVWYDFNNYKTQYYSNGILVDSKKLAYTDSIFSNYKINKSEFRIESDSGNVLPTASINEVNSLLKKRVWRNYRLPLLNPDEAVFYPEWLSYLKGKKGLVLKNNLKNALFFNDENQLVTEMEPFKINKGNQSTSFEVTKHGSKFFIKLNLNNTNHNYEIKYLSASVLVLEK